MQKIVDKENVNNFILALIKIIPKIHTKLRVITKNESIVLLVKIKPFKKLVSFFKDNIPVLQFPKRNIPF